MLFSLVMLTLSAGASAPPSVRIASDLRAERLDDLPVWRIVHEQPISANAMLVQTPGGDLVLADTPWTPKATRDLLHWIKTRFGALPVLATISHYHFDASGGIAALQEAKVPIVVSDHTTRLLAQHGESMRVSLAAKHGTAFQGWVPPLPRPTFDLGDGFATTVGGTPLEVRFPGRGHAPDNVVTWFPEMGVLFGGCMVKGDALGYLGDANLGSWPIAMDELQKLKPKVVVPGHGQRVDPKQLSDTKALLE